MKQNMYKISAQNRFQAVIQFLRKELGWPAGDPLVWPRSVPWRANTWTISSFYISTRPSRPLLTTPFWIYTRWAFEIVELNFDWFFVVICHRELFDCKLQVSYVPHLDLCHRWCVPAQRQHGVNLMLIRSIPFGYLCLIKCVICLPSLRAVVW